MLLQYSISHVDNCEWSQYIQALVSDGGTNRAMLVPPMLWQITLTMSAVLQVSSCVIVAISYDNVRRLNLHAENEHRHPDFMKFKGPAFVSLRQERR